MCISVSYLVLASSSELRSISKMSSVDAVVLMATGGVSSSRRGSPLCFFLRLFFFLAAPVLETEGSGGSSGSSGSSSRFWLCRWSPPIQNRWASVGMGEVARWAGTISYKRKTNVNTFLNVIILKFWCQKSISHIEVFFTPKSTLTFLSSVSCTKKASPLSPSFMWRSTGSPLISMSI